MEVSIAYTDRRRIVDLSQKINIKLPKEWGEISPSLFMHYLKVRSKGESFARAEIWRKSDIRSYKVIMNSQSSTFIDDIIIDILDALSWMDAPPNLSPIDKFCRTRFSWLSLDDDILYFPDELMEYSSVLEFVLADECYTNITQAIISEDEDSADIIERNSLYLLAILARPLSGDYSLFVNTGDRRISIKSMAHAKELSTKIKTRKLPLYTHTAIMYFTGVKQWIHDKYGKHLFGGEGGEGTPGDIDLGWHSSIAAVAKQGVFGNVEEVEQINIHRFLLHLVDEKQSAAREKRKISTP